jgi:hypothetical protein
MFLYKYSDKRITTRSEYNIISFAEIMHHVLTELGGELQLLTLGDL